MTSKTDTRLIIFLIIIGFSAVFLSYFQFKGTIYSPFKQVPIEELELPDQAEVFAILSEQDTDGDGLSDFDERFVYKTSVYVFDSDSDSFSDKEEVDAQSDPLNPESTPYHTPPSASEETISESVLSPVKPDNQEEKISIQEIRDLLINQAGLSQEIVDKLDDKTLESLYNETKQETGIDLKQLQALDDQQRQFSDLDVSQIRQFLIEQGADKDMLDSVDDKTLESMFLQSLLNLEIK